MRKVLIAILLSMTSTLIFAAFPESSERMLVGSLPKSLIEDLKTLENNQKINISSSAQPQYENRIPFEVIDSRTHYRVLGTIHKPITHNQGQLPAVIICHGFMGNKFGEKNHYVRLAEMMAKEGLVVIRFDFHGCGDSEGDRQYFSISDMESNGRSIMDFVRGLPFVNPNNIGVYGASLGGHVAIHLAQKYPQAIKSLALFAPVGNGYLWFSELKKSMSENSSSLGISYLLPGESFTVSDKFVCEFTKIKDSVITAALPLHISIVHIQGADDVVVSFTHRDLFIKEAENKNRWIKFIAFPNTGHHFIGSQHYMDIQTAIVDHMVESLIGVKTSY